LQLKTIARHQEISLKYLEQLMAILRSAGFVRSVRGAKGGYVLAKPPSKVRLSEVFNCLEGPVITTECVQSDNYCDRSADCVVKQVWAQVQQAVTNVLESITLQDLVDKAKEKKTSDYQI
jgi:Rrf2 family protein